MDYNAYTGMLPEAIKQCEALIAAMEARGLKATVNGGYHHHGTGDDLRTWGVVADIGCADSKALSEEAAKLGITIQKDGSAAFLKADGKTLTIEDFKTNEITSDLTRVVKVAEMREV